MSLMKLISDIHPLNYFLNKILLGAENLNERKEVEGRKKKKKKKDVFGRRIL